MMLIPYHQLATRLFDTPLLAHPGKARQVAKVFTDRQRKRAGWDDDEDDGPMAGPSEPMRPYSVVEGVAIIPVAGSLVHKLGSMRPFSGMTGYDGLAYNLRMARADPEVKGIWLDCDSYGGEVSGCFDLADEIYAGSGRNGGKPVWGCVNESAYSAAYALMSQCDVLLAGRTAGCGSIGVVMMHADYSQMLAEEGIKVTLIHAGEHKVDGNPYEALPDAVYKEWLAGCEDIRRLFAETVAKGRGVSAEAMLATEAGVFDAAKARDKKMIDGIASPSMGLAAFIQHLNGQ
jgi:capsid assembly protease